MLVKIGSFPQVLGIPKISELPPPGWVGSIFSPQNDGFQVTPFKYGPFLVFVLNFWGVILQHSGLNLTNQKSQKEFTCQC